MWHNKCGYRLYAPSTASACGNVADRARYFFEFNFGRGYFMFAKHGSAKRADDQSVQQREKFPVQWASGGGLAKRSMAGFAKFVLLLSIGCFGTLAHAATDCNQVTEIPVAECQSLMDLYNSTNGANWKNKTGWNQTNMPCSWFGITCEGGHVTRIGLFGNGLSGSIPNFNLPNLRLLFLGRNQLVGNIPNFNLPNLGGLELQVTQLSGNIPNFSNLPKLSSLTISSDQLSGNIPNFSNLPNLTWLRLSGSQLSGSIPNFNLPNLRVIQIVSTQLSGSIPNFNLPNLEDIQLTHNQLSGSIPDLVVIKLGCQ